MATTFNVESFKASLANGGARPNQFAVSLTFPTLINNFGGNAANATARSPFLVSIAELPGQTVNPAIVQYRGREVKFAGDRVYAPWTATILNDTGFTIRKALEAWMAGMEGYQTKTGQLTPSLYQTDITVTQLDRNGAELVKYQLRDAFPVDLSPIGLDFGANDQISTFTCTWQYQYFLPIV